MLNKFGANTLLGYSIEVYGEAIDKLGLDDRITVASMATEMGAIILLFPPNEEVISYCGERSSVDFEPVFADENAKYNRTIDIDATSFVPMISRPGKPHDTVDIKTIMGQKIDSAFIGSCTNGRIEDMRMAAEILKGRKVAPGVVLKIVPATDEVWNKCLAEGLIETFKRAGALVSNAGCAGCAAGQVGQNGPGEVTISTGNRNFPGKQGKGEVYLGSPAIVAASAVAGMITLTNQIPEIPADIIIPNTDKEYSRPPEHRRTEESEELSGRCWVISEDNIDTDMIFHNRYLAITDINEMGQYAFDNLKGYEDFASKCKKGDIIITGKNFGSGSSRQQAVDCFKSLGVQAIIAESFGAIYERNAINAAFAILTYNSIDKLGIKDGDKVKINLKSGKLSNMENGSSTSINPFSDVQMEIYKRGGLL